MMRIKLRNAFTFIEIMIVVVIVTMLMMLIVQWQARFSSVFTTNVADLALQSDARVLFDYMSNDLTAGQLVATGKGEQLNDFDWKPSAADQVLQIIKPKKDPRARHIQDGDPKKPAYPGYPHYNDDGGTPTEQRIPATRVLYETEVDPHAPPGKQQFCVFRTEEEGTYVRKEETPKCDGEPAWSYSFTGGHVIGRRERKAEHVTQFIILPLGFLPKPPNAGAPANAAPDPNANVPGYLAPERFMSVWNKSKPCANLYHIAAIGVHYTSEDVKQGATGSEGRVELVCKYYMEERSANFRFDRAFSSMDEYL